MLAQVLLALFVLNFALLPENNYFLLTLIPNGHLMIEYVVHVPATESSFKIVDHLFNRSKFGPCLDLVSSVCGYAEDDQID